MPGLSYAIITPSFAPDFKRCEILCQTIDQYVTPRVKHYIIIDRIDLPLFKRLQSQHVELLIKEDILPWWIIRPPFTRKFWLSFKTLPLRGWILQQIIKTAVAQIIKEEVLVFIDSDCAFIRPFSLHSFERDGDVQLFRVPNVAKLPTHFPWHRSAGSLLGLPPQDYYDATYIASLVTWRRENVLKMYQHIENINQCPWMEAVCRQWHFSEYILYGVYIDKVLKEQSQHFYKKNHIFHNYFPEVDMTDQEIDDFISKISPNDFAIMVTAKSRMHIERYKSLLRRAQDFAQQQNLGLEHTHSI